MESDYLVRGVSYSDGKPAASLSLSYDQGGGLYAAATGVVGDTDSEGVRPLGFQANLGFARRTRDGWSWDVGVSTARFTRYVYPRRKLQYSELYAGVSAGGLTGRLYWSPDYLGQHVQTLYGEVETSVDLRPDLAIFAHAGLLAPLNGGSSWTLSSPRYDLKAGLALSVGDAELRLAWSHVQARTWDLPEYLHGGDAVNASAAWSF